MNQENMSENNKDKNKKYEWDLTPLLSSDIAPELSDIRKKIDTAVQEFTSTWKGRTDYLEDPAKLKEALDQYELLMRNFGTSGPEEYYFWLRTTQDQISPELKAKSTKADDENTRRYNELLFFTHSLVKIPKKTQTVLLTAKELTPYKHYLERLFAIASYTLSEKEEQILNLTSVSSFRSWIKMTSSFLSKEEREVLNEEKVKTRTSFSELQTRANTSTSQEVRDDAVVAFNEILEKYVDVAEVEINAILATKKTTDELRGYERPDKERHVSDDIDSEIVDTLLEAVSDSFTISQDFYTLKAKLLNKDILEYHERNVPYGSIASTYTFDETSTLVHDVLGALDTQFKDIGECFVQERRVDVYPKKGKRSGAFCAEALLTQPTYILLNHSGTLNDVLTYAHELGHGINFELMKETEHALTFGTALSTAEVASTFMEDFVLEKLLEGANEEEQLAILMSKLNDDVSTIFRQVGCYRFEQELHSAFRTKGYLSKVEIGRLFQKHMSAYMGDSVKQSPGSENWWVYWSHIRDFFYVYSYANGLLISKALQRKVKMDPTYIQKVKVFLSTGLSKSPKDIFTELGIDITDKQFWNDGLQEIQELLERTTALAKKLGKM